MKRNLAVVILILLFAFPALSTAEGTTRFDGNWWENAPEVAKITFVVGFYEGLGTGYAFSVADLSNPCKGEVDKSFENFYGPLSRATFGQIRDGISVFYSDYRNRRIDITSAIGVVGESISGTPQSDIDTMTEALRRSSNQ